MDPDETLAEARRAVLGVFDDPKSDGDALILAYAFDALDDWLNAGGFLPASWRRDG